LIAEILADKDVEHQIRNVNLIVSRGGLFEFKVDEELVFSKKQLERHAEEGEIMALLKQRLPERI
jgi:selenoprotein W-related protein